LFFLKNQLKNKEAQLFQILSFFGLDYISDLELTLESFKEHIEENQNKIERNLSNDLLILNSILISYLENQCDYDERIVRIFESPFSKYVYECENLTKFKISLIGDFFVVFATNKDKQEIHVFKDFVLLSSTKN